MPCERVITQGHISSRLLYPWAIKTIITLLGTLGSTAGLRFAPTITVSYDTSCTISLHLENPKKRGRDKDSESEEEK
jgi:hypothetical protein